MKERTKGFVAGMLVMLLVVAFAGTAVAAYQKNATLNYADIKITLDGKSVSPKDANGNTVEPFIIDGTTYLPIRAVGNALGLNVGWDQSSKTVALTSGGSQSGDQQNGTGVSTGAGKTVYEKNGVKITYTGIDYGSSSVEVKFLIENNSSKNYTVQARNESVNGYMISPIFSPAVNAGKKVNSSMKFFKEDLNDNGISTINNLEFNFHIFNSDTWDDDLDSSTITITP